MLVLFLGSAALAPVAGAQTPTEILHSLWEETFYGAEAAAGAVEQALEADSLTDGTETVISAVDAPGFPAGVPVPVTRADEFRRAMVQATSAAAAAGGMLGAVVQMEGALLDPSRRDAAEEALGEPVSALYTALAGITDDASEAVVASDPLDAEARAHWRRYAAVVRLAAGMVQEARASLAP